MLHSHFVVISIIFHSEGFIGFATRICFEDVAVQLFGKCANLKRLEDLFSYLICSVCSGNAW